MNIKGLGALIPPQVRGVEKVERGIKSDNSSADRDANGQMLAGDEQKKDHPPMDEEQKKKALEHFKNLPAIKDNGWSASWITSEDKNFIVIKDAFGKILRRVPEAELWELQNVRENEKGQLIRRTA
jgi:hypothetical protein